MCCSFFPIVQQQGKELACEIHAVAKTQPGHPRRHCGCPLEGVPSLHRRNAKNHDGAGSAEYGTVVHLEYLVPFLYHFMRYESGADAICVPQIVYGS